MTAVLGNGEPIVGGTITTIAGNAITITNQSKVTYTIDGANARVVKGTATSSIGDLAVGDQVLVQGTVNGTAITATSIIDQGSVTTPAGDRAPAFGRPAERGFMGIVGGFFHKLFGFF